jgi:hypothetical protein
MVSLKNSKRKMARPPVYKDGYLSLVLTPVGIHWTLPLRASLYNIYEFEYFNC